MQATRKVPFKARPTLNLNAFWMMKIVEQDYN